MKRQFIIIPVIMAFLISVQVALADKPILIGGSSYPISTFEEDGKIIGLDFDIVEAILKEVDITSTKRVLRAWTRIVFELDAKKIDTIIDLN